MRSGLSVASYVRGGRRLDVAGVVATLPNVSQHAGPNHLAPLNLHIGNGTSPVQSIVNFSAIAFHRATPAASPSSARTPIRSAIQTGA